MGVLVFPVYAEEGMQDSSISRVRQEEIALAQAIRQRFEHHWLELTPRRASHLGLRLGRLYRDERYKYTWLFNIRRLAQSLTDLYRIGLSPQQLRSHYSALMLEKPNIQSPVAADNKRMLRYVMSVKYPLWRLVFVKAVYCLAWLDHYQLRHQHHEAFVQFLRAFPLEELLADPEMVKAWGVHLANHVYWLYQVTGKDLRPLFIEHFRRIYPDARDATLSEQQYMNKLYTMTHLIIADSAYYQRVVNAKEWEWVLSYFRNNLSSIRRRGKADVIAEIGVCFLLAGLENDPAVTTIRRVIAESVDPSEKMIPAHKTGSFNLSLGEHRNALAIMLLDWQAPSRFPLAQHIQLLERHLPDTLSIKESH